jgi:hypothetical protein
MRTRVGWAPIKGMRLFHSISVCWAVEPGNRGIVSSISTSKAFTLAAIDKTSK